MNNEKEKEKEQNGATKINKQQAKKMKAPGSDFRLEKYDIENFLNPVTREKTLKDLLGECHQLKEMTKPLSKFFTREHREADFVFQTKDYQQQNCRIKRKDFWFWFFPS